MRNNNLLSALLGTAAFFSGPATSCPDAESMKGIDFSAFTKRNLQDREAHIAKLPSQKLKTRIDNVRIFDGFTIQPPSSIAIDGPLISQDLEGAHSHIDAKGATLLPGLIDSHCHPSNITNLQDLARNGVTTGHLMSCYNEQLCASISHIPGLTDLVVGSTAAAAPGSKHGFITSMVDPSLLVNSTSSVDAWMSNQLSWSPSFIKLIAETPGLSQETLDALTSSSHKNGKPVAIHASDLNSYHQALASGADHIQHAPLDEPLSECAAKEIVALDGIEHDHKKKTIKTFTPTLTMLRTTAENDPSRNFSAAVTTASRLYQAFSQSSSSVLPILAGTDANQAPGVPAQVPFGTSLHAELDNLVELAGMTRVEALRAATVEAARAWGLEGSRGQIKEGMRADLVLVEGAEGLLKEDGENKMGEVLARGIKRVWVGGVEVAM